MRKAWRQLITVAVALMLLICEPGLATVSTLFASTSAPSTSSFVGAAFSPNVAPTVRAVRQGANVELSWTPVRLGGVAASYVVWRIDGSTSTQICIGADVPVLGSGIVSCRDRRVAQGGMPTFLYSVQPAYLVGGTVTWSLPPGPPQPVM